MKLVSHDEKLEEDHPGATALNMGEIDSIERSKAAAFKIAPELAFYRQS